MQPSEESTTPETIDAHTPPAKPAQGDTAELRLNAHDTVAQLLPDEIPRTKSYRSPGDGWRVWR